MKKSLFIVIVSLILLGLYLYSTQILFGADSGALSPATTVDDDTVGTVAWTNPNNSQASDDTYTTITLGQLVISHYIKATNFGFSIPAGATIDGIIVTVARKANAAAGIKNIQDQEIFIIKADATLGTTNKGATTTNWPTTEADATYGSSSDLWDETWSAENINDTDFGVAISVQ